MYYQQVLAIFFPGAVSPVVIKVTYANHKKASEVKIISVVLVFITLFWIKGDYACLDDI